MSGIYGFLGGVVVGAAVLAIVFTQSRIIERFTRPTYAPWPEYEPPEIKTIADMPFDTSKAQAWGQAMLSEGWREVAPLFPHPELPRPNHDTEYEFMRKGWDAPRRFRLCDSDPAFNLCGLWWRPLPTVMT